MAKKKFKYVPEHIRRNQERVRKAEEERQAQGRTLPKKEPVFLVGGGCSGK